MRPLTAPLLVQQSPLWLQIHHNQPISHERESALNSQVQQIVGSSSKCKPLEHWEKRFKVSGRNLCITAPRMHIGYMLKQASSSKCLPLVHRHGKSIDCPASAAVMRLEQGQMLQGPHAFWSSPSQVVALGGCTHLQHTTCGLKTRFIQCSQPWSDLNYSLVLNFCQPVSASNTMQKR